MKKVLLAGYYGENNIGMFPMGVKAAEPAGPTEITLTFNLDGFKYFKQGVKEDEADTHCFCNNSGSGVTDHIDEYISLDDNSSPYYTVKSWGLYHKISEEYVKAGTGSFEGCSLDTKNEYYLKIVVYDKDGKAIDNRLAYDKFGGDSFYIMKITSKNSDGSIRDAISYTEYGSWYYWLVPIGKPGIPVTDVDVMPELDLEVRHGREIPSITDLQAGYTDPRYKLTDWQWTKDGNPVTETTFSTGVYSFTAEYTINKNVSDEYICKFKEDDSNPGSISSLEVNGHECGNETIISDDGHTLTLTHTMPKVTEPIKDIEFTLGELTYLLDNGEYTEKDLAAEIGEWRKLKQDILTGKYPVTDRHFEIPLSKVQRYKLDKLGVPEVFLQDL